MSHCVAYIISMRYNIGRIYLCEGPWSMARCPRGHAIVRDSLHDGDDDDNWSTIV